MHVIIVGAGVMGITTAYFLQKRGCEVTIVDRQSGPAMECSYANGGFFSPGLSAPWSAPGAVGMAFRSLFDKSAPFKWRPDLSLRQIRWMMRSLKECREDRFTINRARLTRLSLYSLACLRQIEADASVDFQRSSGGVLQIYREPVPQVLVDGHLQHLEAMGIAGAFLSPEQLCAIEPALARSTPGLFGALHLPDDLAGDCQRFTSELAHAVQRQGGRFLWNTPVEQFRLGESKTSGSRIEVFVSGSTELRADAYVIAAGCGTPMILDRIVPVSLYPIKGYSMTAPLTHQEHAPRHSLFDFLSKTGMARLGNDIRVSGIAEVVGDDRRLDRGRCQQLANTFEAVFPKASSPGVATFWTGFRPATPDGVPFVSRTPIGNLFINAGHGGSGWSMSCGSGKLMADIVVGGKTDIDATDYALLRRS